MPSKSDLLHARRDDLNVDVWAISEEGRKALRRGDALAVDRAFADIQKRVRACSGARNAGREEWLPCGAKCAVWDRAFQAGCTSKKTEASS